jgi:hypothetical protein
MVYGVYVNADADWQKLIRLQLEEVQRSGVLSIADLHVIVSNPSGKEGVAAFFDALPIPIKHIEFHDENKFEYPALSHIWGLANNQTDDRLIAYFHSKGMSYAKQRRDVVERVLTHFTFSQWSKVLRIFDTQAGVHKIGLFPAAHQGKPCGWIWYNFWWARSSLIRTLPKPEETRNRYYYEGWLGLSTPREDGTEHHCYSILSDSDALFSPEEAVEIVRLLHWKLRYRSLYRLRNIFSARRIWPVPDFVSKAK